MKRLINSLMVLVIVIAALAVIISVAASAGQKLSTQNELSESLEPQITNGEVLYAKPAGSGDCTSWAEACQLQTAIGNAVSGDEIWVAKGIHRPSHGLPLSEMTDFTFVAWINWAGGSNWQRIFDFGQNTDRFMVLIPRNGSNRLEFTIKLGGNVQQLFADPLEVEAWVHVAVTLEDDTGRLFVDGVEVYSETITLDPKDVYGPDAWLGQSHWSDDPHFQGAMDEVAIFDRALSTTEISATFQSGWDSVSGKVLGLHMEEDPAVHGSTIIDSSGQGSHGTLETNNGNLNKSVTGKINKALAFDGTDDYLDLPVERSPKGSFQLKSGVALYGGFSGNETSREGRDWEKNVTVLSGDIDENDAVDTNGVITDTANISGTNAYHVVIGHGLTETVVLDGFTITGGYADGSTSDDLNGAGLRTENSNPTLTNIIFSGNWAADLGGGMYNERSSPKLTSVTFMSNTAAVGGGIFNTFGGEVMLTDVDSNSSDAENQGDGSNLVESSPSLTDVDFIGNSARYAGGGMFTFGGSPSLIDVDFGGNYAEVGEGGGMFSDGSPYLSNVNFISNRASGQGGGMYSQGNAELTMVNFISNTAEVNGGGMYNGWSGSNLTDVSFEGNFSGQNGGGMFSEGGPTLTGVTFRGNSADRDGGGMWIGGEYQALTNCTVSDNDSKGRGGGIYVEWSHFGLLTNCTIAGNTADSDSVDAGGGGGIHFNLWAGFLQIRNSIIVGNGLGITSTASGPDVSGDFTSLGYNLIGNASGSTGFSRANHDQVGNDAAPIDPLLDELALNAPGSTETRALLAGSPAIDWIPDLTNGCGSQIATDQRGVVRPQDGDGDDVAACDIGAYEVHPAVTEFEGSPLGGVAPLAVSFTNLSSGDYDTCLWDFGDDTTSDECDDPEHVYETAGLYTVSLMVSGAGGEDTLEKVDYVDVRENIFLPIIVR